MSSVSPACRKRRLNRAVSRNNRKGDPVLVFWRARKRTLRNVYGVGGPTVGFFFFSPPAHLCAVTYITEISLIETLNNQFTSPHRFCQTSFVIQFYEARRERNRSDPDSWQKPQYHQKIKTSSQRQHKDSA